MVERKGLNYMGNRSILISIDKHYVSLIEKGFKKIEVRRNKPNINFDAVGKKNNLDVYETLGSSSNESLTTTDNSKGRGKVVIFSELMNVKKIELIKSMEQISVLGFNDFEKEDLLNKTQIDLDTIYSYGLEDDGKSFVYLWSLGRVIEIDLKLNEFLNSKKEIIRTAPQSWQYVELLKKQA